MSSRKERVERQAERRRRRRFRLWLGRFRNNLRKLQRRQEAEEAILRRDSRKALAMGLWAIFLVFLAAAFL